MKCYYDTKYSKTYDMGDSVMYTIDIKNIFKMYQTRLKSDPTSLFDVGCGAGDFMMDAARAGLKVSGVDIKRYKKEEQRNIELFKSGKIQIKSILDCDDIEADIVYANESMSMLTEAEIDIVLEKIKKSKMLIMVHNTTEDINGAIEYGHSFAVISYMRFNIKTFESNAWWLKKLKSAGFKADFDKKNKCFCAIPLKNKTK